MIRTGNAAVAVTLLLAGGAFAQQALSSLQHWMPLAQQPAFFSAWQQSFFASQQASFCSQQLPVFAGGAAAHTAAAASAPTTIRTTATIL